jgi:hypothetical protein
MTLITRSVTNVSSESLDLFVPGYDTTKPTVTIAPSATLDLFTVLSAEELSAIQPELAKMVTEGTLTVASSTSSSSVTLSGGAQIVGLDYRSGVSANFGPITLFTVTTPGMYQINNYIVNTTSGSGGDSVGQLVFNFPDSSGGNAIYANMPSGINATLLGNTTGAFWATAGNITYTLGSAVFAGGLRMEISATVTQL